MIALVLAIALVAQEPVLVESFTDGHKTLSWVSYFAQQDTSLTPDDSMVVFQDPTTPEGDGWIGIVYQAGGSPSGLAYAEDYVFSDSLTLEAWIFTMVDTVSGGPYNGLAFFIDPVVGGYYSLITDFDTDSLIRLAYHDPSSFMPTIIHRWTAGNGDFTLPSTSSWHKLKVAYSGDHQVWVYFDDILLPGCPITDNTGGTTVGYIGVYTFVMHGAAETRVDGIKAWTHLVGIDEGANRGINPSKPHVAYLGNGLLSVKGLQDGIHKLELYDISGRKMLNREFFGKETNLRVNLGSGIYFVRLDGFKEKVVIVR